MQYFLYVIGCLFLLEGLMSPGGSTRQDLRNFGMIGIGLAVFAAGLFLRYRGLK